MLAGTFNAGNGSLTVVIDGSIYTVDRSHQNYNQLLEAYKVKNTEDFVKFYHKTKLEVQFSAVVDDNASMEFVDNTLMYKGKEVHNTYVKRILDARKAGFPIEPMLKFLENWLQNPSSRAVQEGPDFLANKNLPITDDGCFLAYKSVQSDWYSKASGSLTLLQGKELNGKIYNAVGETIECLRNEVDDERSHECSKGLHVGGLEYSGPGGWYNGSTDKVVICKINPKDVVSVPKDHNAQKVRVCKYEVIDEFKKPLSNHHVGVEATLPPLAKVNVRVITLDNVVPLDTVVFMYEGKNDYTPQERFLLVEEVGEDYIFGTLLPDDPSYEEGNETRKFLKKNIEDLEEYDSEWLEDDDEECDCDDEDCCC